MNALARNTADGHTLRQPGFTLVEVALAILVGLIVAIGASTAFGFAKRSAIRTRQQRDVTLFKSMVEQIKAGAGPNATGTAFYTVTSAQMSKFVDPDTGTIPGLGRDPYTGLNRQPCNGGSCPAGSVFMSLGTVDVDDSYESVDDVCPACPTKKASDIIYLYGNSVGRKFTVTTTDQITKTFLGFVVMETDSDGKIVAAAGGGTADE